MMAVDQIARMMAMDAAEQGGDSYTKAETDALLDGKADLVGGKVPASQLPSYVDDVAEYASTSAFPATGESGKIYIATDTNKTYRWSGSAYVEISESLALGETASTAYPGNKGKANADAISAIKDGTNIDSFADVETALANIPQVTVDQTYSSSSTNPQSGTAVSQAIAKKPGEITTGKQYTIGGQTVTAGEGAEAFNNLASNMASGMFSHAEGVNTTASGFGSHAEGASTKSSGDQSHSEGSNTIASNLCSHAEGQGTTSSGAHSHAEGAGTIASGDQSHSEGSNATASGAVSHAEGSGTKASSANQHVQGKYNVEDANSTYAFIIGNGTANNARHNAFAIDWNGLIYVNGATTGVDVSQLTPVTVDQTYDSTSTNAQSGVAIEAKKPGLKTTGTEYTIGGRTVTAGQGAEVFNSYAGNKAVGYFSHAEGNATIASGNYSHAEGWNTTASGKYSHAEGSGTIAAANHQHVLGIDNVEDSLGRYVFIIGNGVSDDNRHNAFAIDWSGLIYVNGATTGVDVAALSATIGDINSVLEGVL